MRLLVTGGGGFIGSNLLDRLLPLAGEKPAEVHLISRSGSVPIGWEGQAVVHRADALDQEAMADAVADAACSHLCHLAWLGPEHADRYRSPLNHAWAEASISLFRSFVRSGGERIVHVGSCIEYGNQHEGPRPESLPLAADTAYGQAKATVAQFLSEELASDVSTAIARVFFCHGPHEQPERLVPSIILALLKGEAIDLTEGRQRRDYLDARDAADALVALLHSEATGSFNVGAGEAVEVREVATILGRALGREELLRFGARPEGADTAAEITADIGRIASAVGWKPAISLSDGLANTVEWWRAKAAPVSSTPAQ